MCMKGLSIKTADLDDVDSIYHIQASCYESPYLEQVESFFSKIAKTANSCWIAHLNGQTVAYLICLPVNAHTFPALNATIFELCHSPTLLYLHDLAVHPDSRSFGAGQQLIKQAISYAKQQQLQNIGLIAVQGSTAYWQKQGFEISCATSHGIAQKLKSFGSDAVFMLHQL